MRQLIRTMWLLAALLLVCLPLAWAAGNEAAAGRAAVTARTEVWKDIGAGATGSAAVAIMDGGKIVYAEGFGMADRAKSIPVDKDTVFNIGSVSKLYVATAIMQLVDDGKVGLDQPVTAYLPEFTMEDERYKDITVRMVLNHSSGLPGTSGANNFGIAYNKDVYKEVLATLAQSHLKHWPGEMNPYCNDGFTLAEMIVVRVSGKPFMEFLDERVFKPLGLRHTGPGVGMWPAGKGVQAAQYYPPGKLSAEPLEVLSVLGAGGIAASAEDLCRFVDAFSGQGPQILSAKALAELKKEQPAEFHGKLRGPDISFGLGWDDTDFEPYKAKGIKVLGKGGNTGTYTAEVLTAPDQRVTVAVVSTAQAGGAPSIADHVLVAYLAEKGVLKQTTAAVKPPVKAQPIPAALKAFEGYYTNGNNLVRIAMDTAKGTMDGFKVENNAETPLFSAVHNDGYFYAGEDKNYFAALDGRQYYVRHISAFDAYAIGLEKIEPVAAPVQLAVAIDGQKWLRRNAKAFEGMSAAEGYVVQASLISALPGYIEFGGIMRVESPTYAGMPVKAMRDLTELRLIDKGGRLWAWLSGMLFMPADLAATLESGATTHAIGTDGDNEWLKVAEDSVLSFARPAKGRVIVFDAAGTPLYDSAMASGEVFAPAGGWVMLAGEAGDAFTVTAMAAAN